MISPRLASVPLLLSLLGPSAVARHDHGFVENQGQIDDRARWFAREGPMTAYLTDEGFALKLLGQRPGGPGRDPRQSDPRATSELPVELVGLRIAFEGAASAAHFEPGRALPQTRSYVLGQDASRWVGGLPVYGQVVQGHGVEGVRVVWRHDERGLAYDLHLEPHVGVGELALTVEGAERLRLGENGELVLDTAVGTLRQSAPVAWERLPGGGRRPLDSRFVLLGPSRYGFQVDGRDPARALVIDPTITYFSYWGGSSTDHFLSKALDFEGGRYVCGWSDSPDFPNTWGHALTGGNTEATIYREDLTGTGVDASVLIGGLGSEYLFDLSPGAGGLVAVGYTKSNNFPVTPDAFQSTSGNPNGFSDAIVCAVDAQLTTLNWGSYLAGKFDDHATAVARADWGHEMLIIAGETESADFPSANPKSPLNHSGELDVFAAGLRFDEDGSFHSLAFSDLLGGTFWEYTNELVQLSDFEYVIAGHTISDDFPPGEAPWPVFLGNNQYDSFLVRLSGEQLSSIGRIGGALDDYGHGLAASEDGRIALAGHTYSGNLPVTPNAPQSQRSGEEDGYLIVVDPAKGYAIELCTYVGGSGWEGAYTVDWDTHAKLHLAGWTDSSDFPATPGAPQSVYGGGIFDAWLATIYLEPGAPAGTGLSVLEEATYFGGGGIDIFRRVSASAGGRVLLTGWTDTANLPTSPGGAQPQLAGGRDGLLIEAEPLWFSFVESPHPSTPRPRLDGIGLPLPCGTIQLRCHADQAGPVALPTPGWLVLGTTKLSLPFLDDTVLHPSPDVIVPLPDLQNASGFVDVQLPWPCSGSGLTVWSQLFTLDPSGASLLRSSNGLQLKAP